MYLITSAFSGIIGFVFLVIWGALSLVALITILRNKGHYLNLGNRLLWALVVLVVPIVGSCIYLFWKSAKKLEEQP
jgi:hypothetical protein